eukprot:gene4876-6366_t
MGAGEAGASLPAVLAADLRPDDGGRGGAGAAAALLLLAGLVTVASIAMLVLWTLRCWRARGECEPAAEAQGRRQDRGRRHHRPSLARSRRPPCWGARWGGRAAVHWSARVSRGRRRRCARRRWREEERSRLRAQRELQRTQREEHRAQLAAEEAEELAERRRASLRAAAAKRAVCLLLAFATLVLWQVSYLGVRVGEAAQPGHEWSLLSQNVSSLSAHQQEVVSWRHAGAICMQEVRLTQAAQRAVGAELWEEGWQAFWGAPQPVEAQEAQARARGFRASAAPFSCKPGGVGVLVPRGVPATAYPCDTPLRQELWNTRRWVHVAIAYGDAKVPAARRERPAAEGEEEEVGRERPPRPIKHGGFLHLMSVYGHNGSRKYADKAQKTEELLRGALEAAAELGAVPVVICADANMEPGESEATQAALATGEWFDAAEVAAGMRGEEPEHTCHAPNGDSRVDWMIMNRPALTALQAYAQEQTGCPMHERLSIKLCLEQFEMEQEEAVRPRAFPTEKWGKDEETGWSEERKARAAQRVLKERSVQWARARKERNVDALWRIFSEAAEAYLLERSGDALEGAQSQYCGRGIERAPKTIKVAARQSPGHQGAQAVAQRRLLRLQRRMEELNRQCRRSLDAQGGPQVLPDELHCLWRKTAAHGAELLPELMDGGACWRERYVPGGEQRSRVLAAIREEAERLTRAARHAR